MHILGIDHVQLAAPPGCEPAARDFYGELLGLTELEKPAPLSQRGGCWFAAGAQQLHLGVEAAFVPARKAHPCLLVSDLGLLRRRLHDAGVPVEADVPLAGVERLYAHDPFGNRLEFRHAGTAV
jgi:catechol 2,3-dioxygenase-like lactoylglutathione lyase family enzyme